MPDGKEGGQTIFKKRLYGTGIECDDQVERMWMSLPVLRRLAEPNLIFEWVTISLSVISRLHGI